MDAAWLYPLGWARVMALIILFSALLNIVGRELVQWWHERQRERSAVPARKRLGKRIEPVLQAYTVKILDYYMDNKQLPSIAELQQMQREAIEHTPVIWEIIYPHG